mgnify:CR=1 FL=1
MTNKNAANNQSQTTLIAELKLAQKSLQNEI